MESILNSIKKQLGIADDYDHFDADLIMHINSAILVLTQLGVGLTTHFHVTSDADTWADFIGDRKDLEIIKTYIYLKVRQIFDPPQMGYLVDAMNKQIAEFEWRIIYQLEQEVV